MTQEEVMAEIENIQNELKSATASLEQISESDIVSDDDIQEIEKMNDDINVLIDKLEKLIDKL